MRACPHWLPSGNGPLARASPRAGRHPSPGRTSRRGARRSRRRAELEVVVVRRAGPGQDDSDKPKDPSLLDKKPADAAVAEAAGPAGPAVLREVAVLGASRASSRSAAVASRLGRHRALAQSRAAATSGRATWSSSVASGRGTDAPPAARAGARGRRAGRGRLQRVPLLRHQRHVRRRRSSVPPAITEVQEVPRVRDRRRHADFTSAGELPTSARCDRSEHRYLRVRHLRRFRHSSTSRSRPTTSPSPKLPDRQGTKTIAATSAITTTNTMSSRSTRSTIGMRAHQTNASTGGPAVRFAPRVVDRIVDLDGVAELAFQVLAQAPLEALLDLADALARDAEALARSGPASPARR